MIKPSRPVALLCLLSAGCYTYEPIQVGPATPAMTVRADLNSGTGPALASMIGPNAARVEGMLRSANDSSVTMSVSSVTRLSGVEENWNGEQVTLLRHDVSNLSLRTFSRSRTALAAVAAVGGAILAGTAFKGNGEGATQIITPPPPAR